jgi:hypothetical protein
VISLNLGDPLPREESALAVEDLQRVLGPDEWVRLAMLGDARLHALAIGRQLRGNLRPGDLVEPPHAVARFKHRQVFHLPVQ